MKPGRRPKPTPLVILHGNPGHRPINKNEPKPTAEIPACPTWLPREAKAEWKRVAVELKKMGVLTKIDRGTLAAYCQAWAMLHAAVTSIKTEGMVYVTDKGNCVQHPSVGIANTAMKQIRGFCAEFGLSPSARTRLTVERPVEASRLDKFRNRRSG